SHSPQRFRQPGCTLTRPGMYLERGPEFPRGAGIWLGHPECIIGCTGLQTPAPRTGRVTEATPLPHPNPRGDQHTHPWRDQSLHGRANTAQRHRFGKDVVAMTPGYYVRPRIPSAMSLGSWARSIQLSGRLAMREHPLGHFSVRDPEGTTPSPRGGRGGSHGSSDPVGAEPHKPARAGSKPPSNGTMGTRLIKDGSPRIPALREGQGSLGVPDPMYRLLL
ncbi:hypothetical protein ALC60_00926, partial [Trachymyrmex zeteki]